MMVGTKTRVEKGEIAEGFFLFYEQDGGAMRLGRYP